jgi:hypothetical protein
VLQAIHLAVFRLPDSSSPSFVTQPLL